MNCLYPVYLSKMESFIRSKYESKRWVLEGGLPEPESLDDGEASATVGLPSCRVLQATVLTFTSGRTRRLFSPMHLAALRLAHRALPPSPTRSTSFRGQLHPPHRCLEMFLFKGSMLRLPDQQLKLSLLPLLSHLRATVAVCST